MALLSVACLKHISFLSGKDKNHPGSAGYLQLWFYDLTQENLTCKTAVFYDNNGKNTKMQLGGMHLDVIDNGTITVKKIFIHFPSFPSQFENVLCFC